MAFDILKKPYFHNEILQLMKSLLFSLLFVPTMAICQCDSFTTKQIDKFSGEISLSTGVLDFTTENFDKVYIIIEKKGDVINAVISLKRDNIIDCFKTGAKLIILYEDNSKDTLINKSNLSCEGYMSFDLKNQNAFISKKFTDFRFFATDGYIDASIPKKEENIRLQNLLMRTLKCLSDIRD